MSKKDTFHDRLALFIESLGLKPTSFELEMGFSNGSIGKLLNEKRAISSDRLETIVYKYPTLNIEWLLTGRGKMMKSYGKPDAPTVIEEPRVTLDLKGNLMIPIADIKAAAGLGYINNEVLKTSDFVQLPPNLLKRGNYMCVRIKGDSMNPTLQDGGFVIIRLLDRGEWPNLISDRVYIVSDRDGMTYLKRVRNRLANGFIVLTSDNPDKATYPNFNLQQDEILSIWYAEWYLSAKMPNIHDQFYNKIDRLESQCEDLTNRVTKLESKT